MKQKTIVRLIAAALLCAPVAAQAEPRVFPYNGVANFCPSGEQPVTINGVICCGVPNQSTSYQAMMRHGGGKVRKMTGSKSMNTSAVCPEGQKGCFTN